MSNEEHKARMDKVIATLEELLRRGSERLKFQPSWISQLSTAQPRTADMFKEPAALREQRKELFRQLEAIRRSIEENQRRNETP